MQPSLDSPDNFFAKATEEQIGDFANGVLYGLCEKFPGHEKEDVVLGKIWLIGRAYAAAIERRKKNLEIPNDEFYKKVARLFVDSELDERLQSLRDEKSICRWNIPRILDTHKYLTMLPQDLTGLEKRSFASKYLHFHLPHLFFIFDSRAAQSLQKVGQHLLIQLSDDDRKIMMSEKVDAAYATFFLKSQAVKTALELRFHHNMTPRQLDNLLVEIANERLKH